MEDMWEAGDGIRNETIPDGDDRIDSLGQKFENKIHDGKLRATIRMVMECDGGKIYGPGNVDSKTGLPVINALHQKYPATHVPDEADFDEYEVLPNSFAV